MSNSCSKCNLTVVAYDICTLALHTAKDAYIHSVGRLSIFSTMNSIVHSCSSACGRNPSSSVSDTMRPVCSLLQQCGVRHAWHAALTRSTPLRMRQITDPAEPCGVGAYWSLLGYYHTLPHTSARLMSLQCPYSLRQGPPFSRCDDRLDRPVSRPYGN